MPITRDALVVAMPDVVILAAGQGTRLRPLTHDRPKSMLLVGGRPVIDHLLTALTRLRAGRIILVTGHGHDALQSYVGDGSRYGLDVQYVSQAKQLGPGHALMQARAKVTTDEFLMLPADAWYSGQVLEQLLAHKGPALLQVEDTRAARHGVPVVRGTHVADLLEEGKEDSHPSGGAYRFSKRIFDILHSKDLRLRDAIRADIHGHKDWHHLPVGQREYLDLIEVQDLLDLSQRLLLDVTARNEGIVEHGATVRGAVRIGKGTIIRTGTIIEGPVTIGEHCEIGPLAILQPGTAVQNHVRVAPFSILGQCIIQSNVDIGSHTRLDRTYVDRGARMGSGVYVHGERGAIVGADAVLEAYAKVPPGGTIGRAGRVALGRIVANVPDHGMAV